MSNEKYMLRLEIDGVVSVSGPFHDEATAVDYLCELLRSWPAAKIKGCFEIHPFTEVAKIWQ